MNKFIHLMIIKFLGMFNLNEILLAKKDGIKTVFEKKLVIYGLLLLVLGWLYFYIIDFLKFDNLKFILYLGMGVSIIISIFSNLLTASSMLFGDDGDEVIFTLPVTTRQILLCKVIQMYIKNISYVLVIGVASLISFYQRGGDINNLFFLYYVMIILMIPIGPILIATLISYLNNLMNFNIKSKIKTKLIKSGIGLFVVIVLGLLINGLRGFEGIKLIERIIQLFSYIYVPLWLYIKCLDSSSLIYFILSLVLLGLLIWLYYYLVSNHYVRIYSLLRGINKRRKFFYKSTRNLGNFGGLIRKELNYLKGNKLYFMNSFGLSISFSVVLGIVLILLPREFYDNRDLLDSFSLYAPILLSTLVSFKCSTSSSISLERDNRKMLFSLPVVIDKVLLAKWITNIIIGGVIIVVDATMLVVAFRPEVGIGLLLYIMPLVILIIVSFTGLLVDLRFVEKNLVSDAEILGNRIVTFIPSVISVMCLLLVVLFGRLGEIKYTLLAFMGLFIIIFLGEIVYFIIYKKKLVDNLIS